MIFLSKWYRLDNAAKIFPPSKNKYDPKIFRFSVSLKDDINPEVLQQALDLTKEEYPIFKSVLKKGFFWYYLEESNKPSLVYQEYAPPCSKFKTNMLFEVTYYKKRINLEVNHALTDGTGTLTFLKSLVANYLNILYKLEPNEVINLGSIKEVKEDAFKKYKNKSGKKSQKIVRAYQIKDEKYLENRLKIIEGICSTKSIKQISKKYDATITEYLVSVLIKSILDSKDNEKTKPIVITVPVNLRNYYPSYTVRNFFSVVNIVYKGNSKELSDIINVVKLEFQKCLSKMEIDSKMNKMVKLEEIFILRLVPRFLKDGILKLIYNFTKYFQTMTLSNIGVIKMPQIYEEYIDYFDVFISTATIQLCMCSYQDKMVMSFTSQFVNSEIEKNFFRYLTNQNVEVVINSNKMENEND